MIEKVLNIFLFCIKPIYKKHQAYYNIIEEFRNKLPRRQNEAKTLTSEEIKAHPILSELEGITILDLSTHKTSLTESDIDHFFNRLNSFDHRWMFFKDYYKKYTSNLNRFKPNAENRNFDLVMIQRIIDWQSVKPIKPIDVFVYHLKYKVKFTSRIYRWVSIKRKSS